MNKICTSIEQSKKLIELGIDEDTSDMVYLRSYFEDEGKYNLLVGSYREGYAEKDDGTLVPVFDEHIPAWSLVALLDVLPIIERKGYQKDKPRLLYNVAINKWVVDSHVYTTDAYDNQIDACFDMIKKLHELNLL